MRTLPLLSRLATVTLPLLAIGVLAAVPSCSDDPQTTGAGGSGGGAGGGNTLMPGEVCVEPSTDMIKVRVEPSAIFVPPCTGAPESCVSRRVRIVVDPDVCSTHKVTFESSDAAIAPAPEAASVDLHKPTITLDLTGGTTTGKATLTAKVELEGGAQASVPIEVNVLDPSLPSCGGQASTPLLKGGDSLRGTGDLAGATISLPQGADRPNENSFIWSVDPFAADVSCGADMKLDGHTAIGPAITFGPADKFFPRELPLSIPVNPARLPKTARMRHVRVVYSGPAFQAPRAIPVSDMHVEEIDGRLSLSFKAPRLGTYQAFVRDDAGTKTHTRKLTYRALIGISMGGGGTATFGMRHHDRFDVLAPLGGPVDWTWMLGHIERNHIGGFRSIPPGTQLNQIQLTATSCNTNMDCQADETCVGVLAGPPMTAGKCVLMPKETDPYTHPSTFNTWWYEYPKSGNGGSFSRSAYAQIFRDLALMYGNPNGENLFPGAENLPAGVRPDDLSVLGDHQNEECRVWLDPLDGPDHDKQVEIANNCPKERCAHTLTLQNYYDDEFNPDGTFPVITVCDGTPQDAALTPYANTWKPGANQYPLELALAVDYNGNGVRDELEPLIRSGHEPWRDHGDDGIPSASEAGYAPGTNEDPASDDYNAQYNPAGTEGDYRRQASEPFDDFGLDGVQSTAQQPADGWKQPGDGYDVGEGDGKFTVASGLQRFWDRDSHSIARQMVDPAKVPAGALDDAALSRLDVWTDGGTRDLFNFGTSAQHLVGAFAARGRDVAYLSDFTQAPGLDPSLPIEKFAASKMAWDDIPGVVFQRYGKSEPTAKDMQDGSGQHVGTANEILSRLQAALYFIGSRWQEPAELRHQFEPSTVNPDPDAPECEVLGNCTFDFKSKAGRVGPVGVTLPPGYAHADLKHVRYPVIYMLHGYGQSPEDLQAAIILLSNWMNGSLESSAGRLPKAILVFVDGRCRVSATGKPECIQGTFYGDSPRADGAHQEEWWLELMDYVEQNYRTLPSSEIEWTE